jgi:DNA polymerase III sliding clamp (beta) subunit (PCNA family)
MKIDKSKLIEILDVVRPGLSKKDIIEQTDSFAFMDGCVVTYNDEISVRHPIEGLDIRGVVKATEFYAILNKMTKSEVDLEVKGSEVIVKAGRAKAGITLQQDMKLPLEELGDLKGWKTIDGKELLKALEFVMFSCSRDMSKPILTCMHVRKDGFVESSDNFRLTQYDMQTKLPVPGFLIPHNSAKALLQYNIEQIQHGQGWVHFKCEGGSVFSCRIFEDKFPTIDHLLDVPGVTIALPKKLHDILDKASVFSKRDHFLDEFVIITMKENRFIVRAEAEVGWFEESANMKYNNKPFSFSVNPTFLGSIYSRLTECVVGDGKMKFSGKNWNHIVVLMASEEE